MVEIVLLEDPMGTSVCVPGGLMGDMLSPLFFLTLSHPPDRHRIFSLTHVFKQITIAANSYWVHTRG